MKRFYYLTDSVESVDTIVRDLGEAGINPSHIHVLGRKHQTLSDHHLHPANILQRTDVIRSVERSLMVGCMMSLLFILPLNYIEEFTFNAWILVSCFSLGFAFFIGVIGGLSQENYQIQRFHKAIERGQLLVMIDAPASDASTIRSIMGRQHPEASMQGFGPVLVNPFTPTYEGQPVRF